MKISKIILTFSLASILSFSSFSQENDIILEEQENTSSTQIEESKIIYPYEIIVSDERDKKKYTILVEDPKNIEQRLKAMERTMPMVYNESVKKYLDFFLIRRPSFTKHMLEEKDIYFPIFEKYLKANGMPEELKYLSLLESGLNPKAISRSKAVGLWQFMSFTGKEMGLTINEYIDERMHIEKSTDAACKYLKQLHKRFDDWDLALASYNTGPGRISRTIRSTGKTNYWDLHPHIHPDTRAYVPQFIALAYLMNYGNLHGIVAETKHDFISAEKITVNTYLDLSTLASLSQIPLEEIKALNPHIKGNILPEMPFGYDLTLPSKNFAYFNANRVSILDSASRRPTFDKRPLEGNPNQEVLASANVTRLEDETVAVGKKAGIVPALEVHNDTGSLKYKNITKQVKKIHKVRKGEFLNKIALRYDVKMVDIKKWNSMRSSKVLAGQRLVIYQNVTQKINANSVAAKNSVETIKKSATYKVKPGDTLWNISQKYDGVTISDIKKWNNISGNTVKVGQIIKIKS